VWKERHKIIIVRIWKLKKNYNTQIQLLHFVSQGEQQDYDIKGLKTPTERLYNGNQHELRSEKCSADTTKTSCVTRVFQHNRNTGIPVLIVTFCHAQWPAWNVAIKSRGQTANPCLPVLKKHSNKTQVKSNLISYENGASTQHSKDKTCKIHDLGQTTISKHQPIMKVKI